ncbi:MAG: ribokinase [Succinivibrio sp.]|nr:ribokinase [Succinivibrio sp.]
MHKVIVAGSLNYDIFLEAPRRPDKGETLEGFRWYPKFGGKGGNQALAAAAAGCETVMVGAVGDDSFAPALLDTLQKSGVDTTLVQRLKGSKSGMSVAIMDADGDYGAVIVAGSNFHIDNRVFSREEIWQNAGLLILQNEVSEESNLTAAREARRRGIKICLNAAPVRELATEFRQLIDVLVVNEVEAASFARVQVNSESQALEAARILSRDFPVAVVTAGSHGVGFASRDGESGSESAHQVKLVSTHGAGDCFVGSLCAKLVAGEGLAAAVHYANARAAAHVSAARTVQDLS